MLKPSPLLPTLAIAALTLSATSMTHAFSQCTEAPKEKWQDQGAFQQQLKEKGYQIKKFKVSGTCYEIYGKDKDGKRVEIYFDPVSGEIRKQGD